MEVPPVIAQELAPNEPALWCGRPRQGLLIRPSDRSALFVSLIVLAMAVQWAQLASAAEHPESLYAFIGVAAGVGLYHGVGRFFVDARHRARVYYALTPERLLIARASRLGHVRSIAVGALTDLTLVEGRRGVGTITVGNQAPSTGSLGGAVSWPVAEQFLGPRLDLVAEARQVFDALRAAQLASR